MPIAKCRFDVESMNVGLKNEIELEKIKSDDISGSNVFCILVGKIYNSHNQSLFKNDKAQGNTEFLDMILKEEKHVEVERYDEDGEHFFGVYVPYDVTDNLSFKPSLKKHPSYEDCLLELEFECEGKKKFIYVELASDDHMPLDNGMYNFIANELEDFLCDNAKAEKYGLKYVPQIDDVTFNWYGEIEVMFFDAAGYNVELVFEHVAELANCLVGVRYVEKWNYDALVLLKRLFHAIMCCFSSYKSVANPNIYDKL